MSLSSKMRPFLLIFFLSWLYYDTIVYKTRARWCCHLIIIIIMYIYHALINALSAHMIHINLNMIFYTHVEQSPTKTIYIIIIRKYNIYSVFRSKIFWIKNMIYPTIDNTNWQWSATLPWLAFSGKATGCFNWKCTIQS